MLSASDFVGCTHIFTQTHLFSPKKIHAPYNMLCRSDCLNYSCIGHTHSHVSQQLGIEELMYIYIYTLYQNICLLYMYLRCSSTAKHRFPRGIFTSWQVNTVIRSAPCGGSKATVAPYAEFTQWTPHSEMAIAMKVISGYISMGLYMNLSNQLYINSIEI